MTDISRKPAVLTLPGMDDVVLRADVPYQLSELPRTLDLYYPAGAAPSTPLPAVVFVSGGSDAGMTRAMGCRFKEMASTTSWARLVAASGMIGIAYANGEADDVYAVLKHVRHYASQLGVDPKRIGVWASSGHVPMALSVLMKDREIACAALLYGYMLDSPGSTLVADTLKTWGFANPAAEKSIKDLRTDLPIFLARAGLDHFPHLNSSFDCFVSDAMARNMPIEVVNHASGRHAFDILEEVDASRAVITRVLEFFGATLRR
ncbi:MAG TPA: alpha/beta hydrolase [Vicinamibacterales bacterium]|jgi:acetyl esterase/lipase|nr:alpha/beta hydrolase [Vicinamibacterales bacterium]